MNFFKASLVIVIIVLFARMWETETDREAALQAERLGWFENMSEVDRQVFHSFKFVKVSKDLTIKDSKTGVTLLRCKVKSNDKERYVFILGDCESKEASDFWLKADYKKLIEIVRSKEQLVSVLTTQVDDPLGFPLEHTITDVYYP